MEEQFLRGGRAVGAGEPEGDQLGESGLRGGATGRSRRVAIDATLLEKVHEEIEQAGILAVQLNEHLLATVGVLLVEGSQGF